MERVAKSKLPFKGLHSGEEYSVGDVLVWGDPQFGGEIPEELGTPHGGHDEPCSFFKSSRESCP
eukprot:1422588-Amphidinium_carterae.1